MTTQRQHVEPILGMKADSFHHPLEDLDPISRALVELSVVQNLDDGDIAGMLGRDENEVRVQREAVMRDLALELEPGSADAPMRQIERIVKRAVEPGVDDPLAAFVVPDEPDEDEEPHLHAVPDWLDQPEYEPRTRETKPRSRRRILLVLIGLAVVLAVVVGIQRTGGSSDDNDAAPTPAPSTPAATSTPTPTGTTDEPAAPKGKSAKFAAVGESGATGTISVTGSRLKVNVKGLPAGDYTVWLYNSVIDSKALGSADGTSIKLNAKLPSDAKDYKFVDVSLQPAGSNANHSGESVLRTPTP